MRRTTINRNSPWWLQLTGSIIGFDDDGDGSGDGDGTGDGEPGDGDGNGVTPPAGDGAGEDTAGLKSALQKERADRKALAKRVAEFEAAEKTKTDAEKTEIQRLTDAAAASAQKATQLAEGFKRSAVEAAIIKAAGVAKFKDPTDALRPEVLAALGVEQDEADPTKVTIDPATLNAAIKELAKSRPHYLATAEKVTSSSGSKFGGAGNGGKTLTADERITNMFPALQNRR